MTPLIQEPNNLDLSEIDFDWAVLLQALLDAHKPIQDMSFQGHGKYRQHVDSLMATDIILKFVKSDFALVLPFFDSLIMQHTFGENDEFEEDLRQAFHGHFKRDIK